jgi:Short repeat of unknown function (DUF308)
MEIVMLVFSPGWWKLLNGVLALVFIVAGIVAFVHPGNTFAALAAVFSFFLIFAGTFDIIWSIASRRERCGGSSSSEESSSSHSDSGRRDTTDAPLSFSPPPAI